MGGPSTDFECYPISIDSLKMYIKLWSSPNHSILGLAAWRRPKPEIELEFELWSL